MNVALVLYELARNSHRRQLVWGEEIDALSMQRAFLRRADVSVCEIITMNSYLALCEAGVTREYDLAIHFYEPSLEIPGALNVLYFQQFYDLDRHDIGGLCEIFDRVFTPARSIAESHSVIGYLPLAVDADLYRPVLKPAGEYHCDAVFIGNAPIRDSTTYRELLSPLLRFDVAIYGARWDKPEYHEWTGVWKGVLPIESARDAYAGASVALSIHNQRYRNELSFVTARPFHSLACGRATVSDTNSALTELLPPELSGLRHAADATQFERAVTELLHDEPLRVDLGIQGREFVLQYHTWDVRIEQLLNELYGAHSFYTARRPHA
ncbi:MAG TPA: glycosyltransferase [Longimicrobium sp.]|jgi:hypothetical protein